MELLGTYQHAHYSDGSFFHTMDAIRHNRDISGVWTMFIPDKSEGFTQAGVERLNDSIRTYVWAILGAQAQTLEHSQVWDGVRCSKAPLAAAPEATPEEEERVQKRLERLAAIAAGGQAGQYGLVVCRKTFTADQIDALDNTEIEKLYARYEARMGVAMTKTLGSVALQIYTGTVAMFLPIENQPGLIADLESDPFVRHAFSSATCEHYHLYGMFLAVLTTLKHCQFGHCCSVGVNDGGDEAGESRDGGGASTESSSGKSYRES